MAGGAVVNLVLDCVAVFVFGMGIRGAALSTTVAQWAGLLYLVKEVCVCSCVLKKCNKVVSISLFVCGVCVGCVRVCAVCVLVKE